MPVRLLGLVSLLFAGLPLNRVAEQNVIKFQTGDVVVVMTLDPAKILNNGILRGSDKVIIGFTGVFRTIQYRITSTAAPLPKNLKVKEVLDVVWQNRYPDYDFINGCDQTVPISRDGVFSDMLALGTTDGSVFPPDFRQIVRQRLYLVDNNQYEAGRLLAILEIERRARDIDVRLIWPNAKLFSKGLNLK